MGGVASDRFAPDAQVLSDFSIGLALSHQFQHLLLATAQNAGLPYSAYLSVQNHLSNLTSASMGWPQGVPSAGKLGELGIEWVAPLIQPKP